MPIDPLTIAAILNFAGGFLDDSDETALDIANIQAGSQSKRIPFPGQKSIAEQLGPMLFENLDVGLTEKEKQTFRGAGRSAIQTATRGAKRGAASTLGSQGLRGGNIADRLASIDESIIPQFAQLETDISGEDIRLKRKRISDLLGFLSLSTFEDGGNENIKTNNDNDLTALGLLPFQKTNLGEFVNEQTVVGDVNDWLEDQLGFRLF